MSIQIDRVVDTRMFAKKRAWPVDVIVEIVHPQQVPRDDDDDGDIAIVTAVARGERAALGDLYDRHVGSLFALGLRILGGRREVEDLVHDVFLEAWRAAGDYDPERGSVRTWLLIRMRSRCLDTLRSHAYSRVSPLEESQERTMAARETPEGAEFAIDSERLRAMLEELPEGQRQVLELGYFCGLSLPEIAEQLSIPLGTVKSRVAAAMLKLRRSLGVSHGGNAA